MIEDQTIVVLAPHTDDWELGAGATIARLLTLGNNIFFFTFSACAEMIPDGISRDATKIESEEVLRYYDVDPSTYYKLLDYPVHNFPEHRQEILDFLVKINRALCPGLVIMPSINDCHQDHQTIANEGWRAFKNTRVLCYEMPWNDRVGNPNFFVPILDCWLEMKMEALAIYKSQKHRPYTDPEFVRGWAHQRGIQINAQYAEAFYCMRWVL